MVRKADEQGIIRPDETGRVAGHKVHFYNADRVPNLIEQLSVQDDWSIGLLVFHSARGPGKIIGAVRQGDIQRWSEPSARIVRFFTDSSTDIVPIDELTRLISTSVIARRIGVSRKSFAKLATRKGILPDYSSDCSQRVFYDEHRVEQIRDLWSAPACLLRPGSMVITRAGDVARIEFATESGIAQLRYMEEPSALHRMNTSELQLLVSLRELARSENMSRYKLKRLLTSVGIEPVYQQSKTMYFDVGSARDILRSRVKREKSSVSLEALARRLELSKEVLARKFRNGCIRTIGRENTHCVDEREAERAQSVLTALQSRTGLPSLGICSLQRRGRAGHEVVRWNLIELINVVQNLSLERRVLLFEQVAWLCEGAGKKRLGEALDRYLNYLQQNSEKKAFDSRGANVLLELLDHVPRDFERYRIRLTFASHVTDMYSSIEPGFQGLASDLGGNGQSRCKHLRSCIDQSLAALLRATENSDFLFENPDSAGASVVGEDDFVPGAIIVCFGDKPSAGVIDRVERRSWNALSGRWDKTIVVRFADNEKWLNPHTPESGNSGPPPVAVLMRACEARSLYRSIKRPLRSDCGNCASLLRCNSFACADT
jgi:hypothetical protein